MPRFAALRRNHPIPGVGRSVESSAIVERTAAGNIELAAAAHGLSLMQRRFLTLIDSACTLEALARRYPVERGNIERDLTRLIQLGLVTCESPVAANSDEAPAAAIVRLGGPALPRKLPYVLLPLVAGALAWAAWLHLTSRSATDAHDAGPRVARATSEAAAVAPPTDPAPIAVRTLRGDTSAPAAAKTLRPVSGTTKKAEPKVDDSAVTKADPVLPVEHRSPSTSDEPAAAPSAGHAAARHEPALSPPSSPRDPAVVPAPNVTDAASTRTAAPLAAPVAAVAAAPVAAVAGAAVMPPAAIAPATPPLPGHTSDAAPIKVATAAPAAGLLRRAPAPALVPISREPPDFPREAITAGLASGTVRARLTVDAQGNVSNVEIVEASHRAFDRVVRSALARWRFEPGAPARTTTVDVAFKRD